MTKPWLHIHTDCPHAGGSENMPFNFLQSPLMRRDFEVTFSYRWSREYEAGMGKWVPAVALEGVRVIPLRLSAGWINRMGKRWLPLKALRYPAMLYEVALFADAFRNDKPDILHVNNGGYPGATSCNAAAIAARLAGVPMITYTVNSTARDLWWERPLTALVRKSVTRFVSASNTLKDTSAFLRKEDNWTVVPNTVLHRIPADPAELRHKLGVNGNAFLFVVAGADEPRKGRDVFWRALFKMVDENPKMKSGEDVVGWMSDPDDNRGFSDYDLINAADCLVVPSLRDEDFPNVILIAMMYGKPVLASNVGGIWEMVDNKRTGLLVHPGSVDELADAMRAVMAGNIARDMGAAGMEKFNRFYAEDMVMRLYVRLWKGE